MKITIKAPESAALYPHLKACGFDGIDYSFPNWDKREYILSSDFERDLFETFDAMAAAGLSATQCHLTYYATNREPIGDGSYAAYEAAMLPILERELALAASLKIPTAVIHLFFTDEREASQRGNLTLIGKLLPLLERYGITLAIENIYGRDFSEIYLSSAEDLLFYIEHFNSPYVAACYDSGHAVARGQKPLEMLRRLGDKVVATHLHSNVPGRDLHQAPAMILSTFEWSKLGRTLREIGYKGNFNMEISPWGLSGEARLAYYRMAYLIGVQLTEEAE